MTHITQSFVIANLIALNAAIALGQLTVNAPNATTPSSEHAADSIIADVGGKTTALKSFGKQLASAAAQPAALQAQRRVVAELKEQLKRDPGNADLNARFESELAKEFQLASDWSKGYAALEGPTKEHVRAVRNALDAGKTAFSGVANEMTGQANRAGAESAGINAELDAAARSFQATLAAGKELPAEVDSAVVNMDIIARAAEEDRQLALSRAASNTKSAANLERADALFAQAERVLDRSFLLAAARQRRVAQLAAVRLDRIREWQLHEKMTDVATFVAIGQTFADGAIDKELAEAGGVANAGLGDVTIANGSAGKGAEILRARLAAPTSAPAPTTKLVRQNGSTNP